MDPTNVVALAFLAVAVWLVSRPLFQSVGAAGDVVAQLFVPPNRALGWPHGVQESDSPWGWRSADAAIDPPAAGASEGADFEPHDLDVLSLPIPAGSFVVPVQPVVRRRPH
jgi:hypothetical protein